MHKYRCAWVFDFWINNRTAYYDTEHCLSLFFVFFIPIMNKSLYLTCTHYLNTMLQQLQHMLLPIRSFSNIYNIHNNNNKTALSSLFFQAVVFSPIYLTLFHSYTLKSVPHSSFILLLHLLTNQAADRREQEVRQ